MKKVLYIAFGLLLFGPAYAQQMVVEGLVMDSGKVPIPSVHVHTSSKKAFAQTDDRGFFSITVNATDTLRLTAEGYDTLLWSVGTATKSTERIRFELQPKTREVEEINITRRRMANFDVGFLPAVRGVQITTGTNAVIELESLSGAKSTANPREIFAKIPGINIWESDGAGIQIGIGARGLSPDRAANFNTRQNGYDISADALGYPESYYTPPIEVLKSIEIIRGSASLQYGTQFGGLLNFVIKDPAAYTPLEWTSRTTGGSYGYLGTMNRLSGTKNRFSYQMYHQYKRGNGYRQNAHFDQHQFFAQIGYHCTENMRIRLEYTHMNYLAQQPGGLTDVQFEEDPIQSLRDRNWFKVNWNVLALHYDWEITASTTFNVRAFGMQSTRESLGFLEKVTMQDDLLARTMISGEFQNAGIEARLMQKYSFASSDVNWLKKIKGAALVGMRYYRGESFAFQGNAPAGAAADFSFLNPDNLENSSYAFPSENTAGFIENILFFGSKWRMNMGMRFESISSAAIGYYKQYVVHPVNFDTLAIYTRNSERYVDRNLPLFGAGLSRQIGKRGAVYLNWTQNYRAINFTDIRLTNPNFSVDTLMRDEYGSTTELGCRGLINDVFIYDVALFYLFYGDKIGIAPLPGTANKQRTNVGDAINLGIEWFMEWDVLKTFKDSARSSVTVFTNLSYTDARYIRSKEASYVGNKVEYVSPFIGKIGLKWKNQKWSIQIQGSYNSSQFTDATNSIEPSGDAVIGQIPSYLVFDFSSRYAVRQWLTVECGVNNFTNSNYYTRRAVSYPGPGIIPSDGISAYLTLQVTLAVKNKRKQF